MPITIPNMLNNYQTPLGAAFKNLAATLASQPGAAQQQEAADSANLAHWKMLGMQGLGEQLANGFKPGVAPSVGTGAPAVSPIAPSSPAFVPTANGQVNPIAARVLQMAPVAANVPPVPSGPAPTVNVPQASAAPSAVTAAFANTAPQPAASTEPQIDMGQFTRDALFAGVKPEEAGGYLLLGDANAYGARDPRTTNAAVGKGQSYGTTAESSDIDQANKLATAQNQNLTSVENNAATNATSRANTQANIQKDYGVEAMKEKHADAVDAASTAPLSPAQLDYEADIYRRTGQLPALGMGKAAAALRSAIIGRAADRDAQEGRSGADAASQFAEYQGERSGQRAAGTREANATMAVNELQNLVPVAKQAFANVTRTGFVPADTLLQAYQNGTNDPDLNRAAVAVNDVVNAHARAINPNGQVTDAGRAQGYQLLNTAKNQAAFNAILDQMMVGANAAKASPVQTRADMVNTGAQPLAPHGANAVPAAPAAGGWSVQKVGP